MIPQKPKDIYACTAEVEKVSEDLVEDVMDFYYKAVRKKLSDIEDIAIFVEGLGTFKTYRSKLLKNKARYERLKGRVSPTDSFRNFSIRKEADDRIEKINKLLALLDEEDKRKKEVKEKKDEYALKNMEQ